VRPDVVVDDNDPHVSLCRSYLNMALLQQVVLKRPRVAERYYIMAATMAPSNPNIMINFAEFIQV
jgi:hypothetical protein